MGTYNYTFKSVVKIKNALGWSKKLFVRRFKNDTFESVFFISVEIESVVVSVHPLLMCYLFFYTDLSIFYLDFEYTSKSESIFSCKTLVSSVLPLPFPSLIINEDNNIFQGQEDALVPLLLILWQHQQGGEEMLEKEETNYHY